MVAKSGTRTRVVGHPHVLGDVRFRWQVLGYSSPAQRTAWLPLCGGLQFAWARDFVTDPPIPGLQLLLFYLILQLFVFLLQMEHDVVEVAAGRRGRGGGKVWSAWLLVGKNPEAITGKG